MNYFRGYLRLQSDMVLRCKVQLEVLINGLIWVRDKLLWMMAVMEWLVQQLWVTGMHIFSLFLSLPRTAWHLLYYFSFSFAAGTTDGPGGFNFKQGLKTGNIFWNLVSGLLSNPTAEQEACHAPKPILLNTGKVLKYCTYCIRPCTWIEPHLEKNPLLNRPHTQLAPVVPMILFLGCLRILYPNKKCVISSE